MNAPADPVLQRVARFWDARAREDARRYSVPGAPAADPGAFGDDAEDVFRALSEHVGYAADGARVAIDVGCGAGRLTPALARRAETVVACDVSPLMLEAARARIGATPGVDLRVADATDLRGVGPGEADTVLALGVLTHLPTVGLVADAIAELGRVLRPGGTAVFDVRSGPAPLVLPGEQAVPPHVAGHPLWRGTVVGLETLAGIAQEEQLVIERIAGSEGARSLVLASRETF